MIVSFPSRVFSNRLSFFWHFISYPHSQSLSSVWGYIQHYRESSGTLAAPTLRAVSRNVPFLLAVVTRYPWALPMPFSPAGTTLCCRPSMLFPGDLCVSPLLTPGCGSFLPTSRMSLLVQTGRSSLLGRRKPHSFRP